jgi:hypothetical protein
VHYYCNWIQEIAMHGMYMYEQLQPKRKHSTSQWVYEFVFSQPIWQASNCRSPQKKYTCSISLVLPWLAYRNWEHKALPNWKILFSYEWQHKMKLTNSAPTWGPAPLFTVDRKTLPQGYSAADISNRHFCIVILL